MAKKKEMHGPVEFNGLVYQMGEEDALEAALEAYATVTGLAPEEKKRREAQVEHTYDNLAKQGAYGVVNEDGEITVDHPDATLRAGAVGEARRKAAAEAPPAKPKGKDEPTKGKDDK